MENPSKKPRKKASITQLRTQRKIGKTDRFLGKDRIRLTADTMGIEAGIWRQAQRFFSLLVDSKFNKGRKSEYLIASCLYLACRIHRSDKMMIDFSERLEVSLISFSFRPDFLSLLSVVVLFHFPQ